LARFSHSLRQPFNQRASQRPSNYAEVTPSENCVYQAATTQYGINRYSALCVLCRYRHNGHWTGAKHRLNRDFTGRFGSTAYAREELVAEIGSAFLCASLGIVPTVRHADYISNWLELCAPAHKASNREVLIM